MCDDLALREIEGIFQAKMSEYARKWSENEGEALFKTIGENGEFKDINTCGRSVDISWEFHWVCKPKAKWKLL